MKYAIIDNGIVTNIIEAGAEFAATLTGHDAVLESADAGIGWLWDGQQLSAPQPEPPTDLPPAPETRQITRLAFRNRFSQAEKTMLEIAALDDPSAVMEQRQRAAALRAYMKDVDSATFIDLDRADTRAGVQSLELLGLLAAGRAAEILDAPAQPEEAFR